MEFSQWLLDRDIDCQELTPELLTALQSQYEADCQRCTPPMPPVQMLVLPIDCRWPARAYWEPAL